VRGKRSHVRKFSVALKSDVQGSVVSISLKGGPNCSRNGTGTRSPCK
jgi:hypothetical protein